MVWEDKINRYRVSASVAESILILLISSYLFGRFVKSFLNNNRRYKGVGAAFSAPAFQYTPVDVRL